LCTPTPQTPPLQQQLVIDPSLTGSTPGRSGGERGSGGKNISLPVTVDELKEMISDAVRVAFFDGQDKLVKSERGVGQADVGTPNTEKEVLV
jgi:hypothetical protein